MARILVVDDDDVLLEIVAQILVEAGYSVVTASDGVEAAARFRVEAFDLIITDLVMPNREGIETIIELRKTSPQTPVIAMSGGVLGSTSYLKLAERLGARRTLRKPFNSAELLGAVSALLPAKSG